MVEILRQTGKKIKKKSNLNFEKGDRIDRTIGLTSKGNHRLDAMTNLNIYGLIFAW